jgi:multimeric flavodoxin WrbA
MKVLVTCHARAPVTRVVADEIASALHADVDLIIPRQTTNGLAGWFRSAYETTFDCATDVVAPARNLDAYDVIVIGSPAWRGGVASPVRTYIERQRARLRTIALFTTCGDGGGDRAVDEMTLLCRRDPLARLVVRELDVRNGRAHVDIADFARRITVRASRRAAAA